MSLLQNPVQSRSNIWQQHHIVLRRTAHCRYCRAAQNNNHISIWWDFDNLPPCGETGAAVVMAQRIKHAVLQHGGHIQDIRVYGNTITMTKHDLSMRLLAGVGATCIRVGTKRESVDLAILSDVYWWAQHMGADGTVVLVSSDHDFAPMLAMARSMGCTTVVIGMFASTGGDGGISTGKQALLTDSGNIVHQWSHSPGTACDEGEVETLRHCYQDLRGRTMQHIPLRVGNVVQGPPG